MTPQKLSGPTNEIRYGYLLFFVRDRKKEYERNKTEIWKNLEDAAQRVRVAFVYVDEFLPNPNHNILVCGVLS